MNPVSEEMAAPGKSIPVGREKSGLLASFWLSLPASAWEAPGSLIYPSYFKE